MGLQIPLLRQRFPRPAPRPAEAAAAARFGGRIREPPRSYCPCGSGARTRPPEPIHTWRSIEPAARVRVRKPFAIAVLAATLSLAGCSRVAQPNVVLLLVDDLGWTDLGAYGSTYHETPEIDRLAAGGWRFTSMYAASPVCSPTRASIMTGRHPARLGITDWIGGEQRGLLAPPRNESELPLDERTVAEAFRDAGYATGFFGKWHLGSAPFLPQAQGYDVNVGGHGAGHPASYFYPYARPGSSPWDVPDLEDGETGEYLTDRLTDEALGWLETVDGGPFFLTLSYYNVHTPLEGRPDLVRHFEARVPGFEDQAVEPVAYGAENKRHQDHPVYAAMVASVDESVGRIRAFLGDRGLADRTIVVLVSDNGGLSTLPAGHSAPTSNLPLRAGKGWLYEGGIRIPLIVSDPGRAGAPGRTDGMAMTTDLMPTLLDLAGIGAAPGPPLDGRSLVGLMEGGEAVHDTLFWHFPHYHGSGNRPSGAIRIGSLKGIEWFESGRFELYDLAADSSETRDLSGTRPEDADALRRALSEWRVRVGARMPQGGD